MVAKALALVKQALPVIVGVILAQAILTQAKAGTFGDAAKNLADKV